MSAWELCEVGRGRTVGPCRAPAIGHATWPDGVRVAICERHAETYAHNITLERIVSGSQDVEVRRDAGAVERGTSGPQTEDAE